MDAFEKYYHEDVVVVEATGETRRGKDAQRTALPDWMSAVEEMYGGETEWVTSNEDQAVTMVQSFTDVTMSGTRSTMSEVAIQQWKGDQIIREEFFYFVPADVQRGMAAAYDRNLEGFRRHPVARGRALREAARRPNRRWEQAVGDPPTRVGLRSLPPPSAPGRRGAPRIWNRACSTQYVHFRSTASCPKTRPLHIPHFSEARGPLVGAPGLLSVNGGLIGLRRRAQPQERAFSALSRAQGGMHTPIRRHEDGAGRADGVVRSIFGVDNGPKRRGQEGFHSRPLSVEIKYGR
jgi:hypothetical protein